MITADGIGKSYGAFEAVRDVSFSVNTGDIVGFLGPNGAGKTTILKILTGFHYPSRGKVSINSYDVYEKSQQIKRIIGYLPENTPLYGDLSVKEYLSFVSGARGYRGRERRERIERTVAACGLEEVFYRSIDRISKGFRQRVGLAQAIIHDPDVLVLDEPTNGLDPNQIIEIRELIRRFGREKTVVLSTHILQEAEAVCNRVLILSDGRLVGEGTAESIGEELRGENLLTVRLKNIETDRIDAALSRIPYLRSAGQAGLQPDGSITLKLAFERGAEAGELLFEWAVSERCTILSMQREQMRLEDVFVQLTAEPGGADA